MAAIANPHVWNGHVKAMATSNQQEAKVSLGAYVDDRTIWCTGKSATRRLDQELTTAEEYDDAANWKWNPGSS